MDRELLTVVIGRALPADAFEPAELPGYARYCVRGEAFPTLVAEADGIVEGLLAHGLTREDAVRIRWYETDDYEIRETAIRRAGGREVLAHCCLPLTDVSDKGRAWSFDGWRRHDRELALLLAREWMCAFGAGDVERAERSYQARKRRFLGMDR